MCIWATFQGARGLWVIGGIGYWPFGSDYGYCFWLWLLLVAIGYWLSPMAIGFFFSATDDCLWAFSINYCQWTLVIALGYCYGHGLLVLIIGNCYDYWLWLFQV